MSSSAAIVHQILHSEATFTRTPDGVHADTRALRAILRITRRLEMAWARVSRHRGH